MVHRAILGSLERFIAIVTEHFAGKWPFWLSPRQVLVIPVAPPFVSNRSYPQSIQRLWLNVFDEIQKDYASEVQQKLSAAGLWTDVDNGENTLQKKIRNGEIAQYNFILVVGQEELDGKAVNVRNRDDVGEKKTRAATVPLDIFTQKLITLKESRSLSNKVDI
jgi:threonyl-tRNA synthetase